MSLFLSIKLFYSKDIRVQELDEWHFLLANTFFPLKNKKFDGKNNVQEKLFFPAN